MTPGEEKNVRSFFVASMVLAALNALLQMVLGTILLFTDTVTDVALFLAQNELVEDPIDPVALRVHHFFGSPFSLFAAFYLLAHGIIKIVLIAGLLRNKAWAYPTYLAFLAVFIAYQITRFFSTHSLTLAFVTLFDIGIVVLVVHEYRHYLARNKRAPI